MLNRFRQTPTPETANTIIMPCTHNIVVNLENQYGITERMCLGCLKIDFVCCDLVCLEVTETQSTCTECGSNYVH